jgi:putative peptidoglycan lipid II flippase
MSFLAFFHRSSNTLMQGAVIIATLGLLSRVLGFLRDRLMASYFGAGETLDVYYAAFRIPDLFYALCILGVLSASFIPVFTRIRNRSSTEVDTFVQAVFTSILVILGAISLGAWFLREPLAVWIAPGFTDSQHALLIQYLGYLLWSPLLLGLSSLWGGALMADKKFLAYALAPVLYNVGIIIGITVLYPLTGDPIALAWGVILGALLHLLSQSSLIVQHPHFVGFVRFWRIPEWRHFVLQSVPRMLSLSAHQLVSIFVLSIATYLGAGTVSAMNLAFNIQSLPLGLFGIAFALSAFPLLATSASNFDDSAFKHILFTAARRIAFWILPISFFILVYRAEIVRVLLGSGVFNWEDTILTFNTLGAFALGLIFQSLTPLWLRAYFALELVRLPLVAVVVSELFHILLAFTFRDLGAPGLALAFSVSSMLQFALLVVLLPRSITAGTTTEFWKPFTLILSISVLSALAAQISKEVFALAIDELDTWIEVFGKLVFGGIVSTVAYVSLASWLNFSELEFMQRLLRRSVRKPETAQAVVSDHPEQSTTL